MADERRGSDGRWRAWWRRVVDHFVWDNPGRVTEKDGGTGSEAAVVRPGRAAGAASLDQILLRAADRRARERPAES